MAPTAQAPGPVRVSHGRRGQRPRAGDHQLGAELTADDGGVGDEIIRRRHRREGPAGDSGRIRVQVAQLSRRQHQRLHRGHAGKRIDHAERHDLVAVHDDHVVGEEVVLGQLTRGLHVVRRRLHQVTVLIPYPLRLGPLAGPADLDRSSHCGSRPRRLRGGWVQTFRHDHCSFITEACGPNQPARVATIDDQLKADNHRTAPQATRVATGILSDAHGTMAPCSACRPQRRPRCQTHRKAGQVPCRARPATCS